MNGRKPGESSGSVLSFTYLDVLVCTMGSLLLMLVMFGEKAKRAAIADAKAEDAKAIAAASPAEPAAAPASDDPQSLAKLLADVQTRRAELERMRDEARQTLRDEQQRATHLEEHQRRLEHDLAKLNLTLRTLQATEEKQSVDKDVAAQELERLTKLVAETEKRVDQMRKNSAGKHSYAIVPYKGPNGTDRRPIFIECTHDAIIIQPEGVKLTEVDFEGPIGSGNPLAAAVRAAQEELNARARAAGQAEPPDPYPLFIVRPDGVNAYAVALAATRTWDSDFGYEFVDADWKLEYPEPDARLAQITQHAIEQARERQKLLAQAAPSRYSGRMTGHSGSGGGGGRGRGGSGPGGSVGAEGGFGGASSAGGDAEGGSSVQLAGGTSGSGGTFAEETAEAFAAGGGSGGTGGYAGQRQFDNRYGERDAAGAVAAMGYPGGPGGSGASPTGGASQQTADGKANAAANANGGYGGPAEAGSTTDGEPTAATGGGAGAQSGGQTANGSSTPSNSFATAGSGYSSSSAPPSGASSSNAGGSPSMGTPAPEAFDPHSAPGSQERRAASAASTAAGSGQPDGASGMGLSSNLTKDKNVASAAKTRGANWANADASQRSSAITRPIQVTIRPEQLAVLDPNDFSTGGSVVSFNQPSERVLDQLAAAVKRYVADWGIAGRGMYWRPELVFVVSPGAEPHASRLAALLEDSGIDVRLPAASGANVAARPQEGPRATR